MTDFARIRYLLDNAAGEAFLPDGWKELVGALPVLVNVAEAAHELVGVTSHVNCTGADYAERKLLYAKVRRYLEPLGTP